MLFPGALGDAVCLEPSVAWLARQGPVSVWMRGPAAEIATLFPARPHIDSLDRAECARLFSPLEGRAPDRPSWLRPFGRIVSFTGGGSPDALARLDAAGADVHPFPARSGSEHAADEMLRRVSGVASEAAVPRLDRSSLGRAIPGRLVVHPGSGGEAKRAPRELFRALARDWAAVSGREARVVLGPAEAAELGWWESSGLLTAVPRDAVSLARELAGGSAYVGNDSGPSHVAAAVGTPGVVLFRTSEPERFGPRGAAVRWLRAGQWREHDTGPVRDALASLVP